MMKSIEITEENLKQLLADFGHDLTYHVVRVKNNEPILPTKWSKKLINEYVNLIFRKYKGDPEAKDLWKEDYLD